MEVSPFTVVRVDQRPKVTKLVPWETTYTHSADVLDVVVLFLLSPEDV